MMAMTAKSTNGKLVIEIDLEKSPRPSATGKTIVVASSHGNVPTSVLIDGQPLVVGVNAYVRK